MESLYQVSWFIDVTVGLEKYARHDKSVIKCDAITFLYENFFGHEFVLKTAHQVDTSWVFTFECSALSSRALRSKLHTFAARSYRTTDVVIE